VSLIHGQMYLEADGALRKAWPLRRLGRWAAATLDWEARLNHEGVMRV